MSEVNLKLKKIFPYTIVLAAAVILYISAARFEFTLRPGRIGPDAWPKAVLVLMIIVCIYEIARTLVFGKEKEEAEGLLELIEEKSAGEHQEDVHEDPPATYWYLLAGGIGLTVCYLLLFDVLGFFLDTMLYIILFVLIGRYRRPWVVLASGVLGSLAFMFVFMKIVYLSLPIGHAPFSAVSLALMQLMGIK